MKTKGRPTEIDLRTARTFKVTLYKVLKFNGIGKWTGGHSAFNWTPYLPTWDGKPGKSYTLSTKRELSLCEYGLHISARPLQWGAYPTPDRNTRIFEVQVFGPTKGALGKRGKYGQKLCAYKIRLTREVYNPVRSPYTNEWERITAHRYQLPDGV